MMDTVVRRRQSVVQGFLWVLLGIVALTTLINFLLLGNEALRAQTLLPNVLIGAVLGGALYLNRWHFSQVALGVVLMLTTVVPTIPVATAGVEAAAIALILFFIPLALAGLLLGRKPLFAVGGITLALIFGVLLLKSSGVLTVGPPVTRDDWLYALQFALVYGAVLFFLERFGTSLNDALASAVSRERDLQVSMMKRKQTESELVGEKSFNEAIIASLPGVFVVLDEEQEILESNRNLETVTGYSAREIGQMKYTDLLVGASEDVAVGTIADAIGAGNSTAALTLATRSGARLPYMFSGAPFQMNGNRYIAGFGIDMSELELANKQIQLLNNELEQRLDRLLAMRAVDRAISGSLDLDRTLDVVLEQMAAQLGIDAANVLLYQAKEKQLVYGAGRGFRSKQVDGTVLRLDEGLAGRAASSLESVFVSDPKELLGAYARRDQIEQEGFMSYAAVPLVAKDQLQGVLELYQRSPMNPGSDWLTVLDTLATQTAIALDNATLVNELERSNEELLRAYDATIEGWAAALDLRDEDTEGHSRRVTELTESLARRLGLSEEDITHIRRGALLHDIGKMGIPDSILLKPGRLTPEERKIMEQHTTYAYAMLKPIPFLEPALDIPHSHHEWWDGSGYPQGLEGEQIPLAARIFAVVDVFDALTSDRPYRVAWTHEKACDYLRSQAGTQFEPRIVAEFLAMIGVRGGPRS